MILRRASTLLVLLTSSVIGSIAQEIPVLTPAAGSAVVQTGDEKTETRKIYKRKGTLYYYWGYNRAAFSHSDLRFWGSGYDFTISNIAASDEPGYATNVYYEPGLFTIPQYDQRFGYFLTDKLFVTIGHDHMKYSMDRQSTHLTGYITKNENSGSTAGTYNNADVYVGETSLSGQTLAPPVTALPHGFVKEFEHCDGLNDISAEIGHLEQLWISKNCKYALSALGSVGVGAVIPDTDADVLEYAPKHDMSANKKAFHLAGFSLSSSIGLQFDVWNHFFLLGKIKGGYMDLPDINTTTDGGKASQHFWFVEPMMVVGYYHLIGKKK